MPVLAVHDCLDWRPYSPDPVFQSLHCCCYCCCCHQHSCPSASSAPPPPPALWSPPAASSSWCSGPAPALPRRSQPAGPTGGLQPSRAWISTAALFHIRLLLSAAFDDQRGSEEKADCAGRTQSLKRSKPLPGQGTRLGHSLLAFLGHTSCPRITPLLLSPLPLSTFETCPPTRECWAATHESATVLELGTV